MADWIVSDNQQLSDNYCLLKVRLEEQEFPDMLPGQFVGILVENSPTTFLRRPISINYADKATKEMWLLIQLVGDGTRKLSQLKAGEKLNIIYPLGNSFSLPQSAAGNCLLVGGGVGTAPMLMLGKYLKNNGITPTFLLGCRAKKDLLQLEEFERLGTVYTTTEDGSCGEMGYVIDHSVLRNQSFDRIYTCGPKPMMIAVAKYAKANNIECEVSLENTMACGIGACLCCVEKTVKGNTCVCTEGPVFNIKELTWQI